ncbi:hypothetical protein GALL_334730 [mine drainage metagenome]|uniref:Uncharacterized protein n=1 Tax=mine drainage metagenome TaxID=410659 RepID=A0A1J5QMA8_9ZZZZ
MNQSDPRELGRASMSEAMARAPSCCGPTSTTAWRTESTWRRSATALELTRRSTRTASSGSALTTRTTATWSTSSALSSCISSRHWSSPALKLVVGIGASRLKIGPWRRSTPSSMPSWVRGSESARSPITATPSSCARPIRSRSAPMSSLRSTLTKCTIGSSASCAGVPT